MRISALITQRFYIETTFGITDFRRASNRKNIFALTPRCCIMKLVWGHNHLKKAWEDLHIRTGHSNTTSVIPCHHELPLHTRIPIGQQWYITGNHYSKPYSLTVSHIQGYRKPFQYRDHLSTYMVSDYKGTAAVRPFYLRNGNPCMDKTTPRLNEHDATNIYEALGAHMIFLSDPCALFY